MGANTPSKQRVPNVSARGDTTIRAAGKGVAIGAGRRVRRASPIATHYSGTVSSGFGSGL